MGNTARLVLGERGSQMDGKVKHRQELDNPCAGCIYAPNDKREYYDEACFDCSRFYADKYTKIDEEKE